MKDTMLKARVTGGNTAKVSAKATKGVSERALRVRRGTVEAVTNLPGNAIDVAGATVKGVTNLPGTAIQLATNLHGNAIHLATNLVAGKNIWRNDTVMAAAEKTRVTAPITKINLQLECHNLRRKDVFAECDAFAVIWEAPSGYKMEPSVGMIGAEESFSTNMSLSTMGFGPGGERRKRPRVHQLPTRTEKELGRTEVMPGSCSPKFTTTFTIDFEFQKELTYVVRVYDRDEEFSPDLKEHDFLGGTVFSISELMAKGRGHLKRNLRGRRDENGESKKSFLAIRGVEVKSTRTVFDFRFSAQDLRDRDTVIDKVDDPYFEILKLNPEEQTWLHVYKSEVLMQNPAPTWAKASLPLPVICDDNLSNPIQIKFWNRVRGDTSELLGCVETSVKQMVDGASKGILVLDVWRQHKRKTFGLSTQRKSGVLKILRSELKEVPSMLEYVAGGCTIDLMVAVDCSLINGNSNAEFGLHYRSNLWLNDYQAAIYNIGCIFEPYTGDQDFTFWGFGGDVNGEVVPHFPMGDNGGTTKGALGLLNAYDITFADNPLCMEPADEPSVAPLIQTAMYQAIQKSEHNHCYSVLCIVTAGNIVEDLRNTIDTICTAAEDAPLSIVIIGVGEDKEAFEAIQMALGNGGKLRHSFNGVPIARDIVGFAAFNDHDNCAVEVVGNALKDVPEQLVEYFTSNGILPRPALHPRTRAGRSSRNEDSPHSPKGESQQNHGVSSRHPASATREKGSPGKTLNTIRRHSLGGSSSSRQPSDTTRRGSFELKSPIQDTSRSTDDHSQASHSPRTTVARRRRSPQPPKSLKEHISHTNHSRQAATDHDTMGNRSSGHSLMEDLVADAAIAMQDDSKNNSTRLGGSSSRRRHPTSPTSTSTTRRRRSYTSSLVHDLVVADSILMRNDESVPSHHSPTTRRGSPPRRRGSASKRGDAPPPLTLLDMSFC